MPDLTLIKTRKAILPKPRRTVASKYETKRFAEEIPDNRRMYEQARNYWEQLSDARERANRTYRFYIGQQWSDYIKVRDKNNNENWITEYQYILKQGRVPFVQNIMLATGNTIKGQYLANPSQCIVVARDRDDQEVTNMLSAALDEELDSNSPDVLDPALLEAFINSGMLMESETWGMKPDKVRKGLNINPINYNNIIVNNYTDPRGLDITFAGYFVDTSLDAILSAFAENKADQEYIKSLYPNANQVKGQTGVQTGSGEQYLKASFDVPSDLSMCRLYILWEKRSEWRMLEHDRLSGEQTWTKRTYAQIAAENAQREQFAMDNGAEFDFMVHGIEGEEKMCEFWYYKYLTPQWNCLAYGESPFEHGSHPFNIMLHPLLNGRVYGFMETLVDLNKQINRNYSLRDAMLGGSAKNLLLVDVNSISDEMSREEMIEESSAINGVIVYDSKQGNAPKPEFLNGNTTSLGINDMIERDIVLIMKLQGLGQAIRGETPASGTPAERYRQELLQGQTNLLPIFTAFNNFLKARGMKALSLIQQFKEDGYVRSKNYQNDAMQYDSAKAKSIKDFDMEVTQANDTPVYRQLGEDALMQFLQGGLISIKQMLKQSSLPFADALLQDIESAEAEQQAGQPMNPQLQGALMNAQQQIRGANNRTPQQQELVDRVLN